MPEKIYDDVNQRFAKLGLVGPKDLRKSEPSRFHFQSGVQPSSRERGVLIDTTNMRSSEATSAGGVLLPSGAKVDASKMLVAKDLDADVDYRDQAELEQRHRLADLIEKHFPQEKKEYLPEKPKENEFGIKSEPESEAPEVIVNEVVIGADFAQTEDSVDLDWLLNMGSEESELPPMPEVLESLEKKAERLAAEVKFLTIALSTKQNAQNRKSQFLANGRGEDKKFKRFPKIEQSPLSKLGIDTATNLYDKPLTTKELINPKPGEVTIRFKPFERNSERLAWPPDDDTKRGVVIVVSMVAGVEKKQPESKKQPNTVADFFFFDLSVAAAKQFVQSALENPTFVKTFLQALDSQNAALQNMMAKYPETQTVICASHQGWNDDPNTLPPLVAYATSLPKNPGEYVVIGTNLQSNGETISSWKGEKHPPNSSLEELGITF